MPQLLLQQYLRVGNTPDSLAAKVIKHRRHAKYPHLVLFKYGIMADFSDPIVCECRGIVLDELDNWNVVSRSFDKFFNFGKGHAAEIDWDTARPGEA